MGGPENGKFLLLYVVKCPYVGGWVVHKSFKTPLRNIKMAPNKMPTVKKFLYPVFLVRFKAPATYLNMPDTKIIGLTYI